MLTMKRLSWPLALVVCMVAANPSVADTGFAPAEATDTDVNADSVQLKMEHVKSKLGELLSGDTATLKSFAAEWLVPATIALLILIAGYLIASFVGRTGGSIISDRVDETLGRFLAKMIKNGILIMLVLGVMGYFGIDVTSFAALLAAAGFAVGMALQGTLSNFASGVMLMVFRPFKVGDFVKVGDSEGSVYEIDLFTTRLNTPDNRHMILPNNEVFGSVIHNYSHNSVRRVDVAVGVAYSADIRRTRQVLTGAVAVVPGSVAEPPAKVMLMELGDSSVNWQARVWCRPENYWDVREHVTAAVKEALDDAGISIPFPQMDIHVVNQGVMARAA